MPQIPCTITPVSQTVSTSATVFDLVTELHDAVSAMKTCCIALSTRLDTVETYLDNLNSKQAEIRLMKVD